jgi:hypothetical protein
VDFFRIGTAHGDHAHARHAELTIMLRQFHPFWVNTLLTIPTADPEAVRACGMWWTRDPPRNQSVLRRGINDERL